MKNPARQTRDYLLLDQDVSEGPLGRRTKHLLTNFRTLFLQLAWPTTIRTEMVTNENLEILCRFRFRNGKANKFPQIFFRICFRNDHVGHAQATTAGHPCKIKISEILFRLRCRNSTESKSKILGFLYFILLVIVRADFREGDEGLQLFSFQSPVVHWMARTSSQHCLSCRNPYQTSSLFTENHFFTESASLHLLPRNRLLIFRCAKQWAFFSH